MASLIQRLHANDRAAHGVTPAAPAPSSVQEGEDALALLQSMGLEGAPAAPSNPLGETDAVALRPEPEPVDLAPEPESDPAVEPEQTPPAEPEEPSPAEEREAEAADPAPREQAVETVRSDVLDLLAALSPVFRAASVYPGMEAPPTQVEDAIRRMARATAQLAEAVARDTDEIEVDLGWRCRRARVFTADLVASHWLSSVIRQGGASFDGMDLTDAMPRLARGIQAAIGVVAEQPAPAGTGWSPSAAVFALAPLVLDLQRYADAIKTSLPEFTVEVDAAAQAIGAVAGEEVRLASARLAALVPEAMRPGLQSELMAHVGPMALAAWELVRGHVFAQLQNAPDAAAGMAVLTAPHMTGGVPVAGIVDRLRPMIRRLVGTADYAARQMLGVQGTA